MADDPRPAKRNKDGWKQQSKQGKTRVTAADRQAQIYRLLLAMGVILGVIVGMFFMLRGPARGQILPICISEYNDPRLPPHAFAAQDARLWASSQLDYRPPGELQQHDGIVRALDGLRDTKRHQTLIVHITGHALPDPEGRLCLIPGNAEVGNPARWIPVTEIFTKISDCPAENKLVLVDVARRVADPRIGVLANDAPERLHRLITELQEGRPKDAPVVLTACSPGETSLVSEELGHSVFGWYLHKGRHDAANVNQDNSLQLRELADWVTTGVKTWALANRAEGQTPRLYRANDRDFELEPALKRPTAAGPGENTSRAALPDWLIQEWQYRDNLARPLWWGRGLDRLASREPGQLDRLLLRVEEQWRGDPEPTPDATPASGEAASKEKDKDKDKEKDKDKDKEKDKDKAGAKSEEKATAKEKETATPPKSTDKGTATASATETPSQALRGRLGLLKERLAVIETEGIARLPATVPFSLAMAEATGMRPNPEIRKAIGTQLEAFAAQAPTLKPDQVAAATQGVVEKLKAAAPGWKDAELSYAIFHLAVEAGSDLDKVQLLDRLQRELRPEARYLETLQLRELVGLLAAYRDYCRKAELELPTGLFAEALRATRDAEQARACLGESGRAEPRAFVAMQGPIRKALQDYHIAQVLFRSPGYVAFDEMGRRLKDAASELQGVGSALQEQVDAYVRVDEALRDVPAYADYLIRWSRLETAEMARWDAVVQATANLIQVLRSNRAAGSGNLTAATARMGETLTRIRDDLGLTNLRETLEEADRRSKEGTTAEARRQSLKQLERLLQTSWLKASDRPRVYATARKLAKLLADATNENARSGNVPEPGAGLERDRAFKRARIALGLLRLAGYEAVTDLETALRTAEGAPAADGKDNLLKISDLLYQALARGLPNQLEKSTVAPFEREVGLRTQVSLAGMLEGNTLDPRSNPALALLGERLEGLRRFQGELLSSAGTDFETLEPGQRSELGAALVQNARSLGFVGELPFNLGRITEASLKQGSRTGSLDFPLFGAGSVSLQAFLPGANLLDVQGLPPTLKLTKTEKIHLDLRLAPGYEEASTAPKGFVLQVRGTENGVALHRRVAVAFPEPSNRIPRLLFSLRGGTPSEVPEIPVRAGVNQFLSILAQNPGKESRTLQAAVFDPDEPGIVWVQSDPVNVEGAARVPLILRKRDLPTPMRPGETPGARFRKGLGIHLIDATDKAAPRTLRTWTVQFPLIDPQRLVRVEELRWLPERTEGTGRIVARLVGDVVGEPCEVKLVLDRENTPDLLPSARPDPEGRVGSQNRKLNLEIDDVRFTRDRGREGEVYLTVDGIERALLYRGSLDIRGSDAVFSQIQTPRVGLSGFPGQERYFDPRTDTITTQLVVVNAPHLAEVKITRRSQKTREVLEEPQILPARTIEQYVVNVEGGNLHLLTRVSPTPVQFRVRGNLEPQIIELALNDPRRKDLAQTEYRLLPDASAPTRVKFDSINGQRVSGDNIELSTFGLLPVVASGTDAESKIQKVTFYLGKPDESGNPPKDASPIPAKPMGEDTYGADVELRKEQSTLVSAEFINGVGRRSWATVLVKPPLVTVAPQGGSNMPKPLDITGTVMIGAQPRGGLTVILRQNGVQVGQATTDPMGRFAFKNVAAGQYTLDTTDGATVPKRAAAGVNLTTDSQNVPLSLK